MYGPDHPAYEGLKSNRHDILVRRAWAEEMTWVWADLATEAHHGGDYHTKWYCLAKAAVFQALVEGEVEVERRAFEMVVSSASANRHSPAFWRGIVHYWAYSEMRDWVPPLVDGSFEQAMGI